MRVLVVDQDSALLTAITQLLGEYFVIDAVTTKADCLDLVRSNEYDIIVAGERLEDGSGLELLGQMGRNRPDMLRIFAVERERLKLLKGRLGPFGLFRTLSYPIEPRQLLAALSAAAGIEEEIDGSEDTAPPEPEPSPPRASRAPAAPATPPEPVEVTVRSVRAPAPVQTRTPPPVTPTRVMMQAPAPQARREVHDFTLVDEEPSPPPPKPRPRKGTKSRSSARTPNPPGPNVRGGRQPTPEALAVGSRLAAASRAKDFPPPLLEPDAKRSAFLVAAGVVVIIGAMAIGLHVINTTDTPRFSTVSLAGSHDPPEVVKLVADTEVAFQKDDYKAARTNITALQQISPTHPRLPFFEALLAKHEAILLNTPAQSESSRWFSRHTAPPPKTNSAAAPPRSSTFATRTPVAPPSTASVNTRTRPGASAPANYSSTFSGKTLEDSSKGASGSVVTQEPEILKRTDPEYPDDAAKKGIEGAVDLSFMVSTAGEVRDVTVVHSEPSSIFNRAAVAAVRRWKYRPRTVNGVAVESRVELRMMFKLNGR